MKDAKETKKINHLTHCKMVKNNTTGLVWFGNDLRIHDHEVLSKSFQPLQQAYFG